MIFDSADRSNAEDNFRKTISQLIGGAAVLIGTALAYVQFTQQQQAAQQQFTEQQRASRDLLISNQVAKGFEQLGSDKALMRLGGIYALEGVMNNSEQYHQPVLEALSAFVRDCTRTKRGDGPPATDIQAALTVIGRRKVLVEGETPVLLGVNIPRAFLIDANLSRANLMGANMTQAQLDAADLNSAYMIYANLTQASIGGANLSNADLSNANLHDTYLDYADLRGAHLGNADLRGANLRVPSWTALT
jgi:hypothetical protein